jgi:iron complex transport system ATP-binding protein
MLKADQISYRVGGAVPLAETSFQVESGEFLAIVGPNGAGKTTLLALLAGELKPTSGSVTLGGEALDQLPLWARARRRAYLPPHPRNDLSFTVREVVAMGRHPWRGHDQGDDGLIEASMKAATVEHLSDRVFGALSTGEAQLVHIARILAQGAPLLLLDEPTSGLDAGHQERALHRLAGAPTVVAVIHDLNAAASVADRILILSSGSTMAIGSPSEVLQDDLLSEIYAHPMAVVDHPFRDGPLVLLRGKN